jgi:uncharacterized membrane protein (UPF0127 family)
MSAASDPHGATARCVLPTVWRTASAWERMRGLLGRPALGAGEGLWIEPCSSVHTVGMRYPLDLAFIDRAGVVRRTVAALAPLRFAAGPAAVATLELAAGSLARAGLTEGARLQWREAA